MIRDINDPEHPLTLEELNVVAEDRIEVNEENNDFYTLHIHMRLRNDSN